MTNNFDVKMDEYLPLRDVVFKTLRQAIRKLELEGLVLMIPRKGAEVARISENNLRDVLEVRRTLEELAVDLACQRMTEDELEELKKTQELFAQAIREGDAMRIAQILNNLREQMYRYRLEYIKDEDKRHILLVEHDQILKALSLRHVHEAKIAIREHIDNQEITILKNLKEQENDVQRKVSGRRNPV